MQHDLTQLWTTYPVLDRLSKKDLDADVRYVIKKNFRLLGGPWKDLLEWIEGDRLQHGWSPRVTGLPSADNPFWVRFTAWLKATTFEFEPHRFSREILESVDGISIADENALEILYDLPPEKPKEEPKRVHPSKRSPKRAPNKPNPRA